MIARLLLILTLLLVGITPSRADDFQLPGLQHDAQAYVSTLTKRFPAGGTPAARKTAETQAAAAIAKQDWAAAAQALAEGEGRGTPF